MANLIQAPAGPPAIPKALIEWLEARYPLQYFGTETTLSEIFYNQGQAQLVQTLRHHYNRQNTPQPELPF